MFPLKEVELHPSMPRRPDHTSPRVAPDGHEVRPGIVQQVLPAVHIRRVRPKDGRIVNDMHFASSQEVDLLSRAVASARTATCCVPIGKTEGHDGIAIEVAAAPDAVLLRFVLANGEHRGRTRIDVAELAALARVVDAVKSQTTAST